MTSPQGQGLRGLNAVLKRAREPVLLLDARCRIVHVNRAWEELTGRSAEEAIGLECRPHGPSRGGDLDSLGASFCPPPEAIAGQPAGGATLIVHESGERLWRRVDYWPFHDTSGSLVGLLGIVRPREAQAPFPDSDSQRLRADLLELRERLRERHGSDALIGQGPGHRRLLDQIAAATATSVPVLIV